MATSDPSARAAAESAEDTHYIVLDTETIPDGRLLSLVKYPGERLDEATAISRAQEEARRESPRGSDFLPITFQIPVAACALRLGADYRPISIRCLDAPEYRPAEIVRRFWQGLSHFPRARLVTFNGRGFDLPMLELAAFRYGCEAASYFQNGRDRYRGDHLDLFDWITNRGAYRFHGGLDLLSKILGKPGKMEVSGDKVYGLYLDGQKQLINDYCMYDTLDTYFVFLRTRVLEGAMSLDQERSLVAEAKSWIAERAREQTGLQKYLDNWGDWSPWP